MARPKQKPIVGMTLGDPAGIGPEIVVKALARVEVRRLCRPWVIGDEAALARAVHACALPLRLKICPEPPAGPVPPTTLPLLPVRAPSDERVIRMLGNASTLALSGAIQAVVTAPVHKGDLVDAGTRYPGHTEFFASKAGVRETGMMMVAGPLRVMLVTTHVGIRELTSLITPERVDAAIRLAHGAIRDLFGIARPRIAVAALNPHAGEGGLFGDEEIKAIGPGIERARRQGFAASPPLPADTAFRMAVEGAFDAVVAMYHDQALIPAKLLAFRKAVNLTVGLPFIRTSVDHGTADDIAGKGIADPSSLIAAIRLAVRLIQRKAASK